MATKKPTPAPPEERLVVKSELRGWADAMPRLHTPTPAPPEERCACGNKIRMALGHPVCTGCNSHKDFCRCFAPLADGGEILTDEEFERDAKIMDREAWPPYAKRVTAEARRARAEAKYARHVLEAWDVAPASEIAALRAEIALLKQERDFAREVDSEAVDAAALRAEIERYRNALNGQSETLNETAARAEKAERERDGAVAEFDRIKRQLADHENCYYANPYFEIKARAEKAKAEVERLRAQKEASDRGIQRLRDSAALRTSEWEKRFRVIVGEDSPDAAGNAVIALKARAEKAEAEVERLRAVAMVSSTFDGAIKLAAQRDAAEARAEKLAAALREIAAIQHHPACAFWKIGKGLDDCTCLNRIAARALAEIEKEEK